MKPQECLNGRHDTGGRARGTMATAETLTKFREKLVKSIDDLRSKRDALTADISKEETEKATIEQSLPALSIKLSKVRFSFGGLRSGFICDNVAGCCVW